jgi:hypothetical protein
MELRDDTRPLTARSVVASTLLCVRPSELPARSLVASGGLFGIAEGTVRTALSRMVATGELTLDNGRYALAGLFLSRRERPQAANRPCGPPTAIVAFAPPAMIAAVGSKSTALPATCRWP